MAKKTKATHGKKNLKAAKKLVAKRPLASGGPSLFPGTTGGTHFNHVS